MQPHRRWTVGRMWTWSLGLGLCLVAFGSVAGAQTPASPESAASAVPGSLTVEQLGERLRVTEEANRRLADELARKSREHDEQMQGLFERFERLSSRFGNGDGMTGTGDGGGATATPTEGPDRSPVPDYTEGAFAPFSAPGGYPGTVLLDSNRFPLKASFGPGFQLMNADESFRLMIHYESQIEGRLWGPEDQYPPDSGTSGMYLPRQRIFFDGNITKQVEYELSINRGLNNINLLNAYVNLHFDDQFEVRLGRFFTPFPYDQYAISNYWLLTPERSLFTTNVGTNRQFGAMGWGYLFDKQLDYAVGVFNGSRNSFENANNAMDVVGYLNVRPFQDSEVLPFARFLNVGTSAAFGHQDQSPAPVAFRIGAGSPDANIPGPATVPFLNLNPGVTERGDRLLGSVHTAYFYKSLSLIGEWQYGYGSYTTAGQTASTQVPFSGFYIAGGYFLTGEEVERRTRLKPLRPFIPLTKDEQRGPGAWEAVARVSRFALGDEIFTDGFSDPSRWSNSAVTTELGMNWYWNDYMKVYLFWLHGEFGDPVQSRTGDLQSSADMFWARFQLYF